MIARVTSLTDGPEGTLAVTLDVVNETQTPEVVMGAISLNLPSGTTNAEARAQIQRAARTLLERQVETTRLRNFLAPTNVFTV